MNRDVVVETPDVCGGVPCVVNSRVPVWVLVAFKQRGLSNKDILNCYPFIEEPTLLEVWRYAEEHKEEIQRQINVNENADVESV